MSMSRPIRPPPDLVGRVREMLAEESVTALADRLGLSYVTVLRIAAGVTVTLNSVLIAREQLIDGASDA